MRDNEKTVETIVREKKLSVIEKAEIRHKNRTTEQIENIKYRAESRRQYILLKNDPNYEDVTLNYDNGGLKAININHNEVKNKGGLYEKIVQDIGYQNGHRVILEAEDNTIQGKRNTDGTWDGDLMEIAAAETGTANNIRNALKHCASKYNADVAIIFLPKGIPTGRIKDGLYKYRGLSKEENRQWKEFKKIYVIIEDKKEIKAYHRG